MKLHGKTFEIVNLASFAPSTLDEYPQLQVGTILEVQEEFYTEAWDRELGYVPSLGATICKDVETGEIYTVNIDRAWALFTDYMVEQGDLKEVEQ